MSEEYDVQPLTHLIEQLQREGFDAAENRIDKNQTGLLLGPKG